MKQKKVKIQATQARLGLGSAFLHRSHIRGVELITMETTSQLNFCAFRSPPMDVIEICKKDLDDRFCNRLCPGGAVRV